MGRQFRSEEAAREAEGIKGVILVLSESVNLVTSLLQDLESATKRDSKVQVYLHDEIATAEELERLIRNIEIHELTEEELADR